MWVFHRIKNFLTNMPKRIKFFYQRGKRGYSDQDVWSMDWWFFSVVIPMLKQLRDTKQGYPSEFKTPEEWDRELDTMIHYFTEATEEGCSEKNEYEEQYNKRWWDSFYEKSMAYVIDDSELRDKYLQRSYEIDEYREDMKNKGFEMFSKYFWNLWD